MRPAARDGHTGCIIGNKFIVFGGDRHQMPHNDLHFLDIDIEFKQRNLIKDEWIQKIKLKTTYFKII